MSLMSKFCSVKKMFSLTATQTQSCGFFFLNGFPSLYVFKVHQKKFEAKIIRDYFVFTGVSFKIF